MDAYIFQASLWCEDCARQYMRDHKAPAHVDMDDEYTYDSDDWPKGPYGDGGGEADCPQHCDQCGEFLGNPLTREGREYVREAIEAWNDDGDGSVPVLEQWVKEYGDNWAPWQIRAYAYCGMAIDIDDCESHSDARQAAAEFLRKRRRQGYPVTTLKPGRQWEILEPDGAVMVPDACGTVSLELKAI